MKFVKDERIYVDLTNKEIEERRKRIKSKIDSLENNIKNLQRTVKKYNR